jgi:hypothetical protein
VRNGSPRDRVMAIELRYKSDCRRSGFAMIDDMALLKQAMDQMDAEDPVLAQAAEERAAQILGDARLSFSKMAELIEQRRLLLRPAIVANIKRMDQPGMLGDAAFRNAGSALRREGQSFLKIAEAIERSGRLAPGHGDPVQQSEPPHETVRGSAEPAWRRTLALVRKIVFSPLRRRMLSFAITLIAIFLLYALQGFVAIGERGSGYFNGAGVVRTAADKAISSLSSFVNGRTSPQSRKANAPSTPPAPTSSPPIQIPSSPSATPPAAPGTASAPPVTAPARAPSAKAAAPPVPPPATPAFPSAVPAGPPVSTPYRNARSEPPSKSVANCGAAREDRYPCARRSAPFEDDHPRALEEVIAESMRRNSRMAGRCNGGIGGCYWGGGQY